MGMKVLVVPSGDVVTPDEVDDALRRTGLSTVQFARAIGVDEATLFRWRNGSQRPLNPRQFRWAVQAMERSLAEPGLEPALV